MKKLTVCLVNYNLSKYLDKCLESIFNQEYKELDLIIIDNNSNDNSREIYKKYSDKIRVIFNDKNLGFAKAHNQGIKLAEKGGSKYYCALNIDTVIKSDFFKKIIEFLDNHPGYASVSPRIYKLTRDKKTDIIDTVGGFVRRTFSYSNSETVDREYDCFLISGSAAVFRMNALMDIRNSGEFYDEDYFLYFEDIDISFRLQHAGWKVRYLPDAVLWHVKGGCTEEGGSFFSKNPEIKREILKNRWFTIMKNLPISYLIINLPFICIADTYSLLYLFFQSPGQVPEVISAYFDILKNFKRVIKKRRQIQVAGTLKQLTSKQIFRGI